MFNLFGKRSCDKVLASFTKAIKELEEVARNNENDVVVALAARDALDETIASAKEEIATAHIVADKLKKLIQLEA